MQPKSEKFESLFPVLVLNREFGPVGLNDDLVAAKEHLTVLVAEREKLEMRVDLLNRKHLDPDLLHERALEVLNYGRPDEYIVIYPSDQ